MNGRKHAKHTTFLLSAKDNKQRGRPAGTHRCRGGPRAPAGSSCPAAAAAGKAGWGGVRGRCAWDMDHARERGVATTPVCVCGGGGRDVVNERPGVRKPTKHPAAACARCMRRLQTCMSVAPPTHSQSTPPAVPCALAPQHAAAGPLPGLQHNTQCGQRKLHPEQRSTTPPPSHCSQ